MPAPTPKCKRCQKKIAYGSYCAACWQYLQKEAEFRKKQEEKKRRGN